MMTIAVRDAIKAALVLTRKANECYINSRYDDADLHTRDAAKILHTALLADAREQGN